MITFLLTILVVIKLSEHKERWLAATLVVVMFTYGLYHGLDQLRSLNGIELHANATSHAQVQ